MAIEKIHTPKAPAALGPYSQAIAAGGMVVTAGQIGLDPASGQMVSASAGEQTRQAMTNLGQVLGPAGSSFAKVVKSTIFPTDLTDFAVVNEIYASFLTEPYPARSTVQVAALPKGAKVEIEMVALR